MEETKKKPRLTPSQWQLFICPSHDSNPESSARQRPVSGNAVDHGNKVKSLILLLALNYSLARMDPKCVLI